ncbi:MAG: hypothetical protein K0S39_3843 [Paenibacillus sp.]|nr:hypothetical protein [Paenibacillus sp.]
MYIETLMIGVKKMGNNQGIKKGSLVRIMADPYNGGIIGKIIDIDFRSSFPFTVELENGWTVPYQFNEVIPVIDKQELIA